MEKRFITIKTTPEALKLLRLIAAYTGERQYKILERLLKRELSSIESSTQINEMPYNGRPLPE